MSYKTSVVIEKDENGYYAYIPDELLDLLSKEIVSTTIEVKVV